MTEQESKEDLENKVRELFEPLMKACIFRIESLRLSGSGIIDDHIRNEHSYLVPQAYMSAFLKDRSNLFKGFTIESKRLRKNYLDLL